METLYSFIETLRKRSKLTLFLSLMYTSFVFFILLSIFVLPFLLDYVDLYLSLAITYLISFTLTFLITNFVASNPSKVVNFVTKARDINENDEKERKALEIFENMKVAYGIRNVEIKVLDWNVINAMVVSSKEKSVVYVTKAAIEKLDYDELENVLAHEFAHIKNRDSYYLTLVSIAGTVSVIIAWWLVRYVAPAFFESKDDKESSAALIGLIIFVIGMILYFITPIIFLKLLSSLSKKREKLADITAVLTTKYPPGLIKALIKVAYEDTSEFIKKHKIPKNINMLLFDYEDFETHPKIWERIEYICKYTNTPFPKEYYELKRMDV